MRNRNKVVLLLLVLGLLATVFASCTSVVNFSDYVEKGEDNLDIIARLVLVLHNWIGNYGLTVILFTVFLKVVMLPLDIWQRYSMRKSALKMQEIQPILDAIDKRYGANSDKAKLEKQKVQSKQSLSMFSSCLPVIVSLVVIIVMFGGLRSYATYKNVMNYYELESFYGYSLSEAKNDSDIAVHFQTAKDAGYTGTTLEKFQIAVATVGLKNVHPSLSDADDKGIYIGIGAFYLNGGTYEKGGQTVEVGPVKESFLWIQSIWQPDTWDSVMPTYDSFKSTATLGGEDPAGVYEHIRAEVLNTTDRDWNGLMILPIASIGLSFLSIFLTQKMDKRSRKGETVAQGGQQAMSNKMNMILMPLMMAFFCFTYTGAVAVYMTVNYAFSIVVSIFIRGPIDKMVEKNFKKAEEKGDIPKVNYKR